MKLKSNALFYSLIALIFIVSFSGISYAGTVTLDKVGSTEINSKYLTDIVVSGNYAYTLGNKGDNLYIFDISIPTSPKLVSTSNVNCLDLRIKVKGNYLYGIDKDYKGLKIVDVTNRHTPKIVSTYKINTSATDIALYNNYAYLATLNGLVILDISDPISPKYISKNDTQINKIDINGDYLYSLKYSEEQSMNVSILKLTNPIKPSYINSFKSSRDTGGNIKVYDKYAYINQGLPGVQVFDVSNLQSPKVVGKYGKYGYYPTTIGAVSSNYSYINDFDISKNQSFVDILDVKNSSLPILGKVPNVSIYASKGDYAYGFNNNNFNVYKINTDSTAAVSTLLNGDNVAVFDPANGQWAVGNDAPNAKIFGFGWTGTKPIVGDWNGDGKNEPGVYNPAGNNFVIQEGASYTVIGLGWNGVIPMVGDWNGDKKDEVGVYDPATGQWALWNSTTKSADIKGFGWTGTEPAVGDWNGDGKDEVGVYITEGNNFVIQNDNSHTVIGLGWNGVIPMVGDWNGDKKDEVGVYDPATGQWAVGNDASNARIFGFGWAGTKPIVGDWNGDEKDEVGVYNPPGNNFVIQNDSSFSVIGLGWNGVTPMVFNK